MSASKDGMQLVLELREVAGFGTISSIDLGDEMLVNSSQGIFRATESKSNSNPFWRVSLCVRFVYMHGICFSWHLEQMGCFLSHARFAFAHALQLFCREAEAYLGPRSSVILTPVCRFYRSLWRRSLAACLMSALSQSVPLAKNRRSLWVGASQTMRLREVRFAKSAPQVTVAAKPQTGP